MRTKSVIITMLLLLVATLLPPVARATRSEKHGQDKGTRIVWSRFTDLDFRAARIVISDPRGEHVRELTHSSDGVVDIDPQLSPNGRLIAFERDVPDGAAEIVVVRSNGRDQHVIDVGCTDQCLGVLTPTWAPDGRHLVFTRAEGPVDQTGNASSAVLWRTDLQGKHIVRFSQRGIDGTFEDYRATFAPDGYVVFIRLRNNSGESAIFRMSPDGERVRRLTPWTLLADTASVSPARSGPTHNLVVFETYGHGGPPSGISSAIATVSAARRPEHSKRHIRYLTSPRSLPVQNFNPAWSPNGRRIAFVRFSFVESDPVVHGDIWTMRWNGKDRQRVSRSPLFDFRPAWGNAPTRSDRH